MGPTPARERSSSNRASASPAVSQSALVLFGRPSLSRAVVGVARGAVAARRSSSRVLGRPEDVRTVNDGDGRAGRGRRAGKKSAPSIAIARSSPSGDGAAGWVGAARASSGRTVSRSSPPRPAECSSRSRRLEAGYPRDVSLRLPLTGAARGGGGASFPPPPRDADDDCESREASARATCAGSTRRWRVCGVVRAHGVADGVVSDMIFAPRRAPGGRARDGESDCRTFHALGRVPKRRHVTFGNFLGDARENVHSPPRGVGGA